MSKIYLVLEQKVMLDSDLAEMYGVETKVLKQAVRRNMVGYSFLAILSHVRSTGLAISRMSKIYIFEGNFSFF